MTRLALRLAPLVAALCLAAMPAQARHKQAATDDDASTAKSDAAGAGKKADGGAAGKPVQVGTFGDWGAYLAKGKTKTCYALATPKDRKADGKSEAAYVFIADRPAEKVHNEVSIMMGFPVKESGAPQAKVGSASFDLVAKGSNAWIKDPAEEAKFIDALKHAGRLIVKAPPLKGPVATESYSLAGLSQALDRVAKDCK